MVTFNRRQTIGLIGAAAATGLAAPAIAQGKKIVVGALRFTSHSASFIAAERKYFADAGLDVELRFFQAAQPMAVAIASGDVDYAVTAISGGLISLADKGAIKVIGGALSEEPGIDGQK
jgi:NitT/TauT family transport system substrate-binding protein